MSEALEQISDKDQLKRAVAELRAGTKLRALQSFHGRGLERLIEIMEGEDDRHAMRAIEILGKITGEFKSAHTVEHKHTFEDLRANAATQNGDPLQSLFEIGEREAPVDGELVVEGKEDGDAR